MGEIRAVKALSPLSPVDLLISFFRRRDPSKLNSGKTVAGPARR
jgi:hypothetical protein